jgi:hypothetical protein
MEKGGVNLDIVKRAIARKTHTRTKDQIAHIVRYLKTLQIFQDLFEEEDSFE